MARMAEAGGPTKTMPLARRRRRSPRPLRQEAIARMDAVGTGARRDVEDALDPQVRLGAGAGPIGGPRRRARRGARRDRPRRRPRWCAARGGGRCGHPAGDLAAVGDETEERRRAVIGSLRDAAGRKTEWARENPLPPGEGRRVTSGTGRTSSPHRRVEAGGERQREHPAGLLRQDDAVVPTAGGGVVGRALLLEPGADRRLERLLLLRLQAPPPASMLSRLTVASTLAACSAPIHRDARVRPREQEARRVGPAAHAVIARPVEPPTIR